MVLKPRNLKTNYYLLTTNQRGQSLIETLAAIYILTMALTTALGLAIYAFSRSNISQNEIIAINLAREGIDVIRGMRDSNWLASDVKGAAPWDLASCADIGGRLCYPRAYQKVPPYNKYNLAEGDQRAVFDDSTNLWDLQDNTATADYNLYLRPSGLYVHDFSGVSNYARMINISFNFGGVFPPDNTNSNGELVIKSVVAWRDKNCPEFSTDQDLMVFNTPCKVVLEEHLTNWKDYR